MTTTDDRTARLTEQRFARMRPRSGRAAAEGRHAAGCRPGPRWPAIVQSAALMRFRHPFVPWLHRRYGDVFTVHLIPERRPLVLFSRPEHAREIFAGDPEVFHAGKGNGILGPIMGEHSLLLQDGAEHQRARKLLMPAFNGAALRGYEGLVAEVARAEVDRVARRRAVPGAGADERAHPRGDPARRLRRHRRGAARRAAPAGHGDGRDQPGDPARLGLAAPAEARPVEAHGRQPARARPADLRRDRRASRGPRPRASAPTSSRG